MGKPKDEALHNAIGALTAELLTDEIKREREEAQGFTRRDMGRQVAMHVFALRVVDLVTAHGHWKDTTAPSPPAQEKE